MLKFLRTTVLALSLAVCVLVIAMWVRSYSVEDRVSGHVTNSLGLRLYSSRGWIVCCRNSSPGARLNYPWTLAIGSDFWLQSSDSRLQFSPPTAFFSGSAFASVSLPHWMLALANGIVAAVVVTTGRLSFSLRTLLIATTAVAVVLGIVVASR